MKTCPFCAEDIQDAAIKCRYCGSFLSAAPATQPASPPAQQPAPGPAQPAPGGPPHLPQVAGPATAEASKAERKVLYHGHPSWRAYFKHYVLVVIGTLLVSPGLYLLGSTLVISQTAHALMVLVPLAVGAIAFMTVTLYRRSNVIRVTTTNIETEHGILSKRIDVLELWRCRDVRYRQSLLDRILRIAHIEIFTADVTSPQLELVGLPASRQLFEGIRDAVEIQRQARNVYGVVQ